MVHPLLTPTQVRQGCAPVNALLVLPQEWQRMRASPWL